MRKLQGQSKFQSEHFSRIDQNSFTRVNRAWYWDCLGPAYSLHKDLHLYFNSMIFFLPLWDPSVHTMIDCPIVCLSNWWRSGVWNGFFLPSLFGQWTVWLLYCKVNPFDSPFSVIALLNYVLNFTKKGEWIPFSFSCSLFPIPSPSLYLFPSLSLSLSLSLFSPSLFFFWLVFSLTLFFSRFSPEPLFINFCMIIVCLFVCLLLFFFFFWGGGGMSFHVAFLACYFVNVNCTQLRLRLSSKFLARIRFLKRLSGKFRSR